MGKQVVLIVLVALLATLQVLQAVGLEKTPFPDYLDEASKSPVPQSDPRAAFTQWMGALRSSYSQILRYETDETLTMMMNFAANIETPTRKYKEQIEDILADTDNPSYSSCTKGKKFKLLQQVVSTTEQHLGKCAARLKTLHDEYKTALQNLSAEVEDHSEETVYTPCLPTDSTVTLDDRAGQCLYASVQATLSGFYYPMGATVLSTVTDFRSSIAHERDIAHACAMLVRGAHAQALSRSLEETTSCLNTSRLRVRRGFGKKFKKLFKKAKKGIKKVCSKVPCQIAYSVPFG